MRRYIWFIVLMICAFDAYALESLRVGNRLLVVGDSVTKVKEMLGNPVSRSKNSGPSKHARKNAGRSAIKIQPKAKDKGEKWLYRKDGHTITVTIADGKVVHLDDVKR